jgi:prepilin-type N-terminal cleavage/methylation domain-containing protein/prepilin-type processing-associated H-X9-DG protein
MCSIRCSRRARKAFTLVELLAVISILVLLISLLLPALTRAREMARFSSCQNTMHTLGVAALGFAASHDGRGPGQGVGRYNQPSQTSISWADILNAEFFHGWQIVRIMDYSQGAKPPPKGKIICPDMKFYSDAFPRPFKFNTDAHGGWDDSNRPEGPYGKLLPNGYFVDTEWDIYALGANLSLFPNPSGQFLASEGERANDDCPWGNASPPFGVTLGTGGGYPPWASDDGQFAFRHLLPRDTILYPSQARGSYLFIDGHVEALGPGEGDRVNAKDRYAYRQ